MKKVTILIITLLLLVGCSKEEKEIEKPIEEVKKVTINLFYWKECGHCHEEIEWLNNLDNENVKIVKYEVTEYAKLDNDVRAALNAETGSVPLTIIGTEYINGFGTSTRSRIMNLVDKYVDKDYCDLVSTVKNNGDIESCFNKNNNI